MSECITVRFFLADYCAHSGEVLDRDATCERASAIAAGVVAGMFPGADVDVRASWDGFPLVESDGDSLDPEDDEAVFEAIFDALTADGSWAVDAVPPSADVALAAWRAGNDAGRGFPVGDDDDTCEAAAELEGWTVVARRERDDQICIARRPDGTFVGIGDAGGAWGVEL